VPEHLESIVDTRSWLGWVELWRSDDPLVEAVGGRRREERMLLAHVLDYALAGDELEAVSALIEGLLSAVCAPMRTLPLPQARPVLSAQVGHALARAAG